MACWSFALFSHYFQFFCAIFCPKEVVSVPLCFDFFRESEDTALLLLKEIYDNLGVPLEQPQI